MAPNNDSVTVGTSSVEVLAKNPHLSSATLVNDSENIIYLAVGADAVANSGIRLGAGTGITLCTEDGIASGINAIADTAGSNLCVFSNVS